jgi:hypothetical protein
MTNATPNLPWSEIASEAARTLTGQADQLSRTFADAFAQVPADRLPDFHSRSWRYEICIFMMFWFWYVANSPKFCRAGGTKPLVDAYHRACYKAFVEAGLISTGKDSLREWEDDVEASFLSCKEAYDAHLGSIREDAQIHAFNITGRGTVGWLLAHHLFSGQQPDSRVVILLNEFGSVHFTELFEMLSRLENTTQF